MGDEPGAEAKVAPSPSAPSLAFSSPAEIPDVALTLLNRQLQLVAAAQSEIARGLQPIRNKDGKVVGTELGADGATKAMSALVAGARLLVDVHELFAPRAQARAEDGAVNADAARALAAKLVEAERVGDLRLRSQAVGQRATDPRAGRQGTI